MTAAAGASRRFTVDSWDPAYGASLDPELAESRATVDVSVEQPADGWLPVRAHCGLMTCSSLWMESPFGKRHGV